MRTAIKNKVETLLQAHEQEVRREEREIKKEHPVFGEGIQIKVMTPIEPICEKHNYRLLPHDAECAICFRLRKQSLSEGNDKGEK